MSHTDSVPSDQTCPAIGERLARARTAGTSSRSAIEHLIRSQVLSVSMCVSGAGVTGAASGLRTCLLVSIRPGSHSDGTGSDIARGPRERPAGDGGHAVGGSGHDDRQRVPAASPRPVEQVSQPRTPTPAWSRSNSARRGTTSQRWCATDDLCITSASLIDPPLGSHAGQGADLRRCPTPRGFRTPPPTQSPATGTPTSTPRSR